MRGTLHFPGREVNGCLSAPRGGVAVPYTRGRAFARSRSRGASQRGHSRNGRDGACA